jgi:hypothetical protein
MSSKASKTKGKKTKKTVEIDVGKSIIPFGRVRRAFGTRRYGSAMSSSVADKCPPLLEELEALKKLATKDKEQLDFMVKQPRGDPGRSTTLRRLGDKIVKRRGYNIFERSRLNKDQYNIVMVRKVAP